MSEKEPLSVYEQPQKKVGLRERIAQRFSLRRGKTLDTRAGSQQATVAGTTEGEIVIVPRLQETRFDCGQTVLDMLGYKGHEMFPDREVTSAQLRNIPGAREITLPVGREEEIDYSSPKVWIVLGKDKVAGAQHWVIRHKNKIYCPTIGEMDVAEYKTKYVGFVLQEFEIPVAGRIVAEYHNQPGKAQYSKIINPETITSDQEVMGQSPEYGSWEWAKQLAHTSNIQDPNWWYNCAGAKGYRARHDIQGGKRK